MSAHRHALFSETAHRLDQGRPALELDHLDTAFLHQPARRGQGALGGGGGEEGQVADQQCAALPAGDAGAVIDHLVHGHGHRGRVSLQDHAERVADQYHLDPGGVQQAGEARVVAGETADALAPRLHGGEGRDGDRRGGHGVSQGG